MKPQQFSGEGSLGQEPKRTFREKLREACESALFSNTCEVDHQNGRKCLLSIPKEFERRRRSSSYRAEDPIRTMMFLGSWSHT